MTYIAPYKKNVAGVWRWVVTRTCENGHTTRILANRTKIGRFHRPPSLPHGAIQCAQCDALVKLASPIITEVRG